MDGDVFVPAYSPPGDQVSRVCPFCRKVGQPSQALSRDQRHVRACCRKPSWFTKQNKLGWGTMHSDVVRPFPSSKRFALELEVVELSRSAETWEGRVSPVRLTFLLTAATRTSLNLFSFALLRNLINARKSEYARRTHYALKLILTSHDILLRTFSW